MPLVALWQQTVRRTFLSGQVKTSSLARSSVAGMPYPIRTISSDCPNCIRRLAPERVPERSPRSAVGRSVGLSRLKIQGTSSHGGSKGWDVRRGVVCRAVARDAAKKETTPVRAPMELVSWKLKGGALQLVRAEDP